MYQKMLAKVDERPLSTHTTLCAGHGGRCVPLAYTSTEEGANRCDKVTEGGVQIEVTR